MVTLALVLDEDGFPKASMVFPGNVGESGTLREILKKLQADRSLFPPTVVMDAGVATEENRELIRQAGYHYVCVSRSRPKESPQTVSLTNDQGERIHIRQTTDPEPFHLQIYHALGLPPKCLRSRRVKM
ncbi:MAG: transposase [Deltaproteobacteria bacterium]|nr:transposase [Deltaproteobacteria bacterium]